ncbi:MAG: GTPase Era [Gammaproteobacteria bacterium]
MDNSQFKSGYVAVIGKPNVGKSTLLNAILGTKTFITSRKAQTTRNNILAIKNLPGGQIVFLDTPGIHNRNKKALNKVLNKSALSIIADTDLVVFLCQPSLLANDITVIKAIKEAEVPSICVINKIDQVKNKNTLLPLIQNISREHNFLEITSTSAIKNDGIDKLLELILSHLPAQEPLYANDLELSVKERLFQVDELVREKLIRQLGAEIPYELYVESTIVDEDARLATIYSTIHVNKTSQKSIVVGNKGEMLKKIGTLARKDLERLFSKKVMLKLWVKSNANWSNDQKFINSLGIGSIKNAK